MTKSSNEMEAFYASLLVDTNTQLNNDASVRTRPSEETQKAMKILQGLLSQKFSSLLHSSSSAVMKDTLNYLLSLPAPEEEGFSLPTKWVILQLSESFAQWSLDYENASPKHETATAGLSEAEKMKHNLEANVEDFRHVDKKGKCVDDELDQLEEEKRDREDKISATDKKAKCLSDELDQLLEEKRDLEDKINAVNAKIAKCTAMRDRVAKRRVELFGVGRVVKDQWDYLRNNAPKWKGEKESAKITQADIEAEWLKLVERFNKCVDMEKWP